MPTIVRLVAVATLLATAAAAQTPPLQVEPVAAGIYMLTGDGGNIGVCVGDDGIVMVDDKFARLADDIRAALGSLSDGRLLYLLNTHFHGDHTGANAAFGLDTPILAQRNVRQRLLARSDPDPALPVITFVQGLDLHVNGLDIRAVHMPHAHTDGDAVITFLAGDTVRAVHTGDVLFNRRFPFVDLDAGGSIEGLVAAAEQILQQVGPDTPIIPGHGPLATAEDLRTYLRMIRETSATVTAGVQAGKSLKQLQAEGLGPEWDDWSWAFIDTDTWVETLYRTATQGT